MEASDSLVTLEDDDPEMFCLFNVWLYTGKSVDEDESWETISWEHLCQSYASVEKRLIPSYQNTSVDAVIVHYGARGRVPRPE